MIGQYANPILLDIPSRHLKRKCLVPIQIVSAAIEALMKKNSLFVLVVFAVVTLSGCFKVGTLEYKAYTGEIPQDKSDARLIPETATVLRINGMPVDSSIGERMANFFLNFALMYLEPQVSIKPGANTVSARVSTSNSISTGYYTYTTTYWRDYDLKFTAEAGKEYALQGDFYGGTVWIEDRATKTKVNK